MQTMQTRRRLLVVLAAVSIAATLISGCSKGFTQSGAPLPDATTLVKQSTDVTKNLKSAHLVLSVIGKIPGLPIKTLTGDLTTAPATAASGEVQLTMGGSEIDANFVVLDGELYATLTPNKWSDFGKAADIYDVSTILNPDTGVANVLANLNNPEGRGPRDHQRAEHHPHQRNGPLGRGDQIVPASARAIRHRPPCGFRSPATTSWSSPSWTRVRAIRSR